MFSCSCLFLFLLFSIAPNEWFFIWDGCGAQTPTGRGNKATRVARMEQPVFGIDHFLLQLWIKIKNSFIYYAMEFYDKLKLDDLFYDADAKIKEGKYADAMQTLEAILAEAPDYGKAYNHLAWLYNTKYRDLTKAADNYEKCLLYEPEYTPVYLNYASVLSAMSKWKELEALLTKALAVPGVDKASVYNEYGIMNELRGNYNEAIANYKDAIRNTLVTENVTTYQSSIKRCQTKKELLT